MANILKRGDKFNKLTYIEPAKRIGREKRLSGWFACDCGAIVVKTLGRVVCGYTKTCGNSIHLKGINKKHGMRLSTEYTIWQGLKWRVLNKNDKDYEKYHKLGGDSEILGSFEAFYREVGPRPSRNHSIDRIDNTKGYVKGNMRWSTSSQQQTNKAKSVFVYINGLKFNSRSEASKHFGVTIMTIKRWCEGYSDKRRSSKFIPPKKTCYYEKKY